MVHPKGQRVFFLPQCIRRDCPGTKKVGERYLPNCSRSSTDDEVEQLWSCGELGTQNPRALNNTVFFTVCMGMAMRGREKHHSMDLQYKTLSLERTTMGRCLFTTAMEIRKQILVA